MATFAGTTQKCKACEKTVYLVEQLTADNKVYHKFCFRCHHCKNTLKLSNYCSFEGVLYCKPHFDQLLKKTGSLDKSFEAISRTARVERSSDKVQTNNKVARLFVGTQEKCVTCKKTVYPIEKVAVDAKSYHKAFSGAPTEGVSSALLIMWPMNIVSTVGITILSSSSRRVTSVNLTSMKMWRG